MRQDDAYQEQPTQGRPAGRASGQGRRGPDGSRGGAQAVASVFSGVLEKAKSLINPHKEQSPRTSGRATATSRGEGAFAGDDYLGTGEPCRVCGRPVEPTQSRCPHCGAFRVPLYQQVPFWVAVVVLVVLVVVLSCVVNSCGAAKGGAGNSTPATPSAPSSPVATDKTALSSALADAQPYIDENDSFGTYTVASVNALRTAMSTAQATLADDSATEDEVSADAEAISSAVGGLMKCPTGLEGYSWLDYATLQNSALSGTNAFSAGSGVVLQVTSGTDYTTMSVAFDGDSSQVINVAYNDLSVVEGTPAEGSSVTFAGTVTAASQYENADGETVTTPTLVADYVYQTDGE